MELNTKITVLDFFSLIKNSIGYAGILPLALLCAVFILRKILRVSYTSLLFFGALPFVLQHINFPLNARFEELHPFALLGGAWLVLIFLVLGINFARALFSGMGASTFTGTALALIMLAFVSLLLLKPEIVEQQYPDWRANLGIVLLCVSCLAFVVASLRFLKAGIFLAIWALSCLVIGSEVLLGKLPQDFWHQGFLNEVTGASMTTNKKLVVLGGRETLAPGLNRESVYPTRLEAELTKQFPGEKFEVTDLSSEQFSLSVLPEIIESKVLGLKPNLVLISAWESSLDNEPGTRVVSIGSKAALNSRLLRLGRYVVCQNFIDCSKDALPALEALEQSLSILQAHGVKALILSGPKTSNADLNETQARIPALVKFKSAKFIDIGAEIERRPYDLLLLRSGEPSNLGHKLISRTIVQNIRYNDFGEPTTSARFERSIDWLVSSEKFLNSVTLSLGTLEGIDKLKQATVEFLVNDKTVATKAIDGPRASFNFPREYRASPALKLGFKILTNDLDLDLSNIKLEEG